MFKKVFYLVLILMLIFIIGGCTEEEEPEEEDLTENEELEEEENPEQEEPEAEKPEAEEPSEENDEEAPAPDDEEEKSSIAKYDWEDMKSEWEGEIDFRADGLYDQLITEEEIHFLYRKDEALYYQSFDLENGQEITQKKVEEASSQMIFDRSSDTTIKLHDYNDHIYALIGENRRISEEEQEEQKMLLIDLEEDEVLLSKSPVIENFTFPKREGTYLPGFIYDVTADGRYLMILHSFPGMSGWDNYLMNFKNQKKEDIEEENQVFLNQIKDVPLWVYDIEEQRIMEIPYDEEIEALVPYDVEGLANGINLIFTEEEGWLTLDVENRLVRKTEEGGTYQRIESEFSGIEEYRKGTLFGESLFLANLQEIGKMCEMPEPGYLYNFDGQELEHLGNLGLKWGRKSFHYNKHNGEIIINKAAQQSEEEREADAENEEYVERIYRLTIDQEKVLENEGDERVESLEDLKGFEIVDVMEFSVGTYQEGKKHLSLSDNDVGYSFPLQDFSHLDYGILIGRTLERVGGMKSPFFYAYRNDEEEEKIVEIDGAELILTTDNQLIVLLDNQMQAFNLEEFFDALEQ
ncbi:hypothetical protein [Isachenkonia alkalipeptolytica]|uniref:Lipoprotein n=1 Tax=Isachenkonia alkalipeptolytica TaxID=2565777 RepID=A0AA43XJ55_9CLOT|nr:hypothetical protein [Isachenkonia alkalipeptolytica]NBG87707.1 hypothetical protein [Isachenkonia alkalipeptolytica]